MALCTIIYNASTGSDTAASGSNAPTTAITGTNADVTGTTVTLNEEVNFTGVADDDTDVIWIDTPAGERHLFRITAFTGGVSTCTALTVLPSIGLDSWTADNWAVGGIRQTLDNDTSRPDLEDGLSGWVFELEGSGPYPIGQTNTIPASHSAANGSMSLVAASGATPEITWTGDFAAISIAANAGIEIIGITFTGTVSTSSSQRSVSADTSSNHLYMSGCTCSQYADAYYNNNSGNSTFESCNLTTVGAYPAIRFGGRPSILVTNCVIQGCGDMGLNVQGNSGSGGITILGNIIRDNTDQGITLDVSHGNCYVIANNVIHGNGAEGIRMINTPTAVNDRSNIFNNIITNNGSYGIHSFNGVFHDQFFVRNNAFYSNTGGNYSDYSSQVGDVTLTADPYTDSANDDYTLNDTAEGGADCKDAGYGYNG